MKLVDMPLTEFVKELASKSPAPGGGSVAALSGALSASLCGMVARLTTGKEKYREAWGQMEKVIRKSDDLKDHFIALVDKDSMAYSEVVRAMALPKETEDQNIMRKIAIQEAIIKAAQVPMETLRSVLTMIELTLSVIEHGNPNCVTDAGTAVQLIRAAGHAASYNVFINLAGVDDQEIVNNYTSEVKEILDSINNAVEPLEEKVMSAVS